MTKKNSLRVNGYLVGNYSQYLNALDFKQQHKNSGENYLFILCTNSKVYREFKKNIQVNDWNNVFFFYSTILIFLTGLHIPRISGFCNLFNEYYVYRKALSKVKKFDFDFFVVGNYFYPTYRSVSNQVNKKNTVIVDDGANIVYSVEKLVSNDLNNYLAKSKFGFFLFSGLNINYESAIIYFGCYDKLKFRKYDQIIINKKYQNIGKLKLEDCIYIIGQKLYNGMISLDYYLNILKESIKEFDIKQFFYVPHRMENENDIKKIQNVFQILKPGEPIESYIIKRSTAPHIIISFYSSALLNLKMFNLKGMELYAVKSDKIKRMDLSGRLDKVYKYYQNAGIQIIKK